MKLAIVVGKPNQLPPEVVKVLRKMNLNPMEIEIPEESRHFRTDAKIAYMDTLRRLKIPLVEGMAIVRLDDRNVVLAQGLRSAIIQLTADLGPDTPPTVDPIMISFSWGQVVAVKGNEPYPVPA